MQALRINDNQLRLAEIPTPQNQSESLIRVVKSGICNTDLEIINGYAGFDGTIGHEFVGVVEESPDNPELVGKRVVGEINVGCNRCTLCKAGDSRHCADRTVLGIINRDGCHAEYLTLPARNLVEIPDEISNDQAIFIEPLAAAFGITEQVNISREQQVAVIGDGKLGILCAWSLALKTEKLFLIGKHKNKLEIAQRKDVEGVLLDDADKMSRSFDVVIEASGSESGFETALNLLKPRGKLILKSTFHGKPKWEAWRVVVDEVTIIGSRCGIFSPVLDLLKNKDVDVESLISEEFSLKNGVRAIEKAGEKGVMKVVLSMAD